MAKEIFKVTKTSYPFQDQVCAYENKVLSNIEIDELLLKLIILEE